MKKLAIYGGIVIVIFIALAMVTNYSQTEKAEGNPYGKERLNSATLDLLDDPNYQNIILPEELETSIESGEGTTVYFYSPTCVYCRETTPMLAPLAEELNVDLVQYNLLEFEEGWNEYRIESTPTVVHFENGEEVARVVGAAGEAQYEQFLTEMTK